MTLTVKERWHRYICEEEYIGYEFYLDDLLCGDGYIYIGTKEINRFGNLGYHILEEYQHRGYATIACHKLIAILQSKHLNKIYIVVDKDNVYSNKLCKRVGGMLVSEIKDGCSHKYKYQLEL